MQERRIDFGQERGEEQNDLIIDAQTLFNDNHSEQALLALEQFNEARAEGDLDANVGCSDARVKSLRRRSAFSVRNIAASQAPVGRLAADRGVGRWLINTHFSSATLFDRKMPTGCGGLAAKGNIQSVEGTEIEAFVRQIPDKDAFVTSIRTAEKVADLSGKPTAAFAMDHLTHDVFPIAYFKKNGRTLTRVSAMRDYDIADYDPARIYAEGLPTLDERDLPDEFQEIIELNKKDQQEELMRYPDLTTRQEVQKPRMIIFTTDIRSIGVKFPRLAAIPGSMFKINVPRYKTIEDAPVQKEALDMAFRQLWYPIHYAPQNFDVPEKQFSNTDTLIIETGALGLSRSIWEEVEGRRWMREWTALPNRKVILLQSNAGKINNASEITF